MADTHNPYAPPKAALEDAPAAPGIELASRGARFGAAVIDTVTVLAGVAVGMVLNAGPVALWAAVAAVGGIDLWTVHRHRASLGKLALKLRVVRRDGAEAELWRIVLLRWLPTAVVGVIPGVALLNLVDAAFIFRGDRRCIHDMIADTVVVDA